MVPSAAMVARVANFAMRIVCAALRTISLTSTAEACPATLTELPNIIRQQATAVGRQKVTDRTTAILKHHLTVDSRYWDTS
mmetsp:Transcript_12334/g.22079  ORF Transcript_12334/g.22079 Transcript_12334/m.22079 type:complete len:81 (-) Transcript_12334:58-300(-)